MSEPIQSARNPPLTRLIRTDNQNENNDLLWISMFPPSFFYLYPINTDSARKVIVSQLYTDNPHDPSLLSMVWLDPTG
ncbi:hypothetical protein H4Q26_013533 [Puccinia striiformis f. sp. tritici PST-130]|nr:hypothetical protein H4Q26_013533 [Puccinia striiformis f. sp. tritici PST-130]